MKVLSLDAGISTGFILWEMTRDSLKILSSGTICDEDLEDSVFLSYQRIPDLHVIIEEPLLTHRGKLTTRLMSVVQFFHRLFPDSVKVLPGTWKPLKVLLSRNYCSKVVIPREYEKLTVHQRDALYIGLYYFLSQGKDQLCSDSE